MAILDFTSTGWEELDTGDDVVVTANRITMTAMDRRLENWLTLDSEAIAQDGPYNFASGFEYRFTVLDNIIGGGDDWLNVSCFGFANVQGSEADLITADESYLKVGYGRDGGGPMWHITERDGTESSQTAGVVSHSQDVTYYVTVILAGTTLTLTSRTGSHTGSVKEVVVHTMTTIATTFRYLYAMQGQEEAAAGRFYTGQFNDFDEVAVAWSDTSAPILSSATVNADGDTLTMVFSENVAGTPAGFTITADGDTVVLSGGAIVDDTITYDIEDGVTFEQTVLLTYAGTDITDGTNDLGAFSDQAVTNNSSVPASGPVERARRFRKLNQNRRAGNKRGSIYGLRGKGYRKLS